MNRSTAPEHVTERRTAVPATTTRAVPTLEEVVDRVDLTGRRALVTGGSSGVGEEIARALTAAGAEVVIADPDVAAAEAAARRIHAATDRARPSAIALDLLSPDSIAAAADAWTGPLHILVAHAETVTSPVVRTSGGWETQFRANHLGHFALVTRLHAALAAAGDARVVLASADADLLVPVDLDELWDSTRPHDARSAYGVSKTALILFAVEARRRWAEDGISVTAYAPGSLPAGLHGDVAMDGRRSPTGAMGDARGAVTPVLLAGSPDARGIDVPYVAGLRVTGPEADGERAAVRPEVCRGIPAFATDPMTASRLWNLSEQATRRR